MKTTFKQYIQEAVLPKAKSLNELVNTIKNGKFTKDGSHLVVTGNFICNKNNLVSLRGVPTKVRLSFHCSLNKLTSLEGAPTYVGGDFFGNHNSFTSLKDIHKHIDTIDGYADFSNNKIKSHILGLLKIKNLTSVFINNTEAETIINKYLPEGDIFACQQELIDAGLEAFAQL